MAALCAAFLKFRYFVTNSTSQKWEAVIYIDGEMLFLLVAGVIFLILQLNNADHHREKSRIRKQKKYAKRMRSQGRAEKPRPTGHRR